MPAIKSDRLFLSVDSAMPGPCAPCSPAVYETVKITQHASKENLGAPKNVQNWAADSENVTRVYLQNFSSLVCPWKQCHHEQ